MCLAKNCSLGARQRHTSCRLVTAKVAGSLEYRGSDPSSESIESDRIPGGSQESESAPREMRFQDGIWTTTRRAVIT
jgi:hypothetical protein